MSVVKKTLYFTMVRHPKRGWIRCGNAFDSRANAQSWIPFVRRTWRGCAAKVAQCTLQFVDGKLSSKSVSVLDQKFNMDPPKEVL